MMLWSIPHPKKEFDDEDLNGLKNLIRMDSSSFCDVLDKVRH